MIFGKSGGTKSTRELEIRIEPMDFGDGSGTKNWVRVYIRTGRDNFVPSFEELYYIIKFICQCEDKKYPGVYQEGRLMVERLLCDCCDPDIEWEEIRKKYKIPKRNKCMGK
jgi:hypothetical protein